MVKVPGFDIAAATLWAFHESGCWMALRCNIACNGWESSLGQFFEPGSMLGDGWTFIPGRSEDQLPIKPERRIQVQQIKWENMTHVYGNFTTGIHQVDRTYFARMSSREYPVFGRLH